MYVVLSVDGSRCRCRMLGVLLIGTLGGFHTCRGENTAVARQDFQVLYGWPAILELD